MRVSATGFFCMVRLDHTTASFSAVHQSVSKFVWSFFKMVLRQIEDVEGRGLLTNCFLLFQKKRLIGDMYCFSS